MSIWREVKRIGGKVDKSAIAKVRSVYRVPGQDRYCIGFRFHDEDGSPTDEMVDFVLDMQELYDAITEYRDRKEESDVS